MGELLNWIITNLEAFAENIVNAAMMLIVVIQSFSNKKNLKILKNNNKLDKQEIEKEEIKKLIKKGKKNMKKLTEEERKLLREILNEDETLKKEFIKDIKVFEPVEAKKILVDDFEKEDTNERQKIEETERMVVLQTIAETREIIEEHKNKMNIIKQILKQYNERYELPEDIKGLIENE